MCILAVMSESLKKLTYAIQHDRQLNDFEKEKLSEPNYYGIVHELFTCKPFAIKDTLDLYYGNSSMKGKTFYFKLITQTAQYELFNEGKDFVKDRAKLVTEACTEKMKEISEKDKRFSRAFWNNLISGGIGTLLGALIGLAVPFLQPEQKPDVFVFQKEKIVHDTVYKVVKENPKDTLKASTHK
jgi:hypothetical protein